LILSQHRDKKANRRMDPARDLAEILSDLGGSVDAVAATLKTAGITGVRNTVSFLNPIVRYCQGQLSIDHYIIDVIQTNWVRIVLPGDVIHDVRLPTQARAFLDAFNAGAFPDLERPGR
jgi:hypothetical protein